MKPVILIDADACPVKDAIYDVAYRYDLTVFVIANSYLRVPNHPLIKRMVVSDGFDAADDAIAEVADLHTIVITSDILLAERCLKKKAKVLSPKGDEFNSGMIGDAVATRALMADLRAGGEQVNKIRPFAKSDRSKFLVSLDRIIHQIMRA